MEDTIARPVVRLRKKEEHRILGGHLWVFSNEIQEISGSPAAGDPVCVESARGRTIGFGFYNPRSLIACRILAPLPTPVDREFFRARLAEALALREKLYGGEQVYRMVHGESDFLPGLVLDRFGSTVCLQSSCLGMEQRLGLILEALDTLVDARAVIERNETGLRIPEGLPLRSGVLRGTGEPVEISEHGIRYLVDPLHGQKTGFFLDQRENRLLIRRFAPGADVLDCFCHDGGFALNACRGGARSALGLDSSADAVGRAVRNAVLNDIPSARFEEADVFERLAAFAEAGRQFDLVVLDPPSFARNRKSFPTARKGYRELHTRALRVLPRGGILMTASCSHHMDPGAFLSLILEAAGRADRRLQLLDWRGAAPDHPVLPPMPETQYLKMGVFRAL
ncbi:MAG: class I SAM-dependent rRNA methyltransferase [Bacteroidota bacterium]